MIRSIAKHRYFKGKEATKSVKQYVAYVAYRGGVDARINGRAFFDDENQNIKAASVKTLLAYEPAPGQAILAHELVLSPGIQTVNAIRYTRTLMGKLEKSLGRDLNWVAVEHKGAHNHIHVMIDAKDKLGRRVLFRKEEYKRLREWGDQYLEREHGLERFLKMEVDLNAPFEREKGDAVYERLFEKSGVGQGEVADIGLMRKKYFMLWDKRKAVAELDDDEKIYIKGKAFHQFSTSKELWAVLAYNRTKLSALELTKLEGWLADKRDFGDDHHERLARESFARKKTHRRARRKNNNQDDKQAGIKRGTGDQLRFGKEYSGLGTAWLSDEHSAPSAENPLEELLSESAELDEERAQLLKAADDRLAQLKVEVLELPEFLEHNFPDETDLERAELANLDPSLLEFDRDFHSSLELDDVIKTQKVHVEAERQKVDLKIEQEQGTYLAQKDRLALNKNQKGLFTGRIAQSKLPRLRRDFRDNNRSNKWLVKPGKPKAEHEEHHNQTEHYEENSDDHYEKYYARFLNDSLENDSFDRAANSRTEERDADRKTNTETAPRAVERNDDLDDLFFPKSDRLLKHEAGEKNVDSNQSKGIENEKENKNESLRQQDEDEFQR